MPDGLFQRSSHIFYGYENDAHLRAIYVIASGCLFHYLVSVP